MLYLFVLLNSYSYRISNFNNFNFNTKLYLSNDSLVRPPLPNEEFTLPKVNKVTGEILIDRDLIERVGILRSFIEDIEINRGKNPPDYSTILNGSKIDDYYDKNSTLSHKNASRGVKYTSDLEKHSKEEPLDEKDTDESQHHSKIVDIDERTLEPIKDLLCDESLLEEVLVKAFEVYHNSGDLESFQRLKTIAEEMIPIATKFRKSEAEIKIMRLIDCYMTGEEDLNEVLEEMQSKRGLNKYLLQRLDELTNIAAKKYRISEKYPAISESFLKTIKDRIAAQQISNIRGADIFVKVLALCFQADNVEEFDAILTENIKTIEELEEFYEWVSEGIEFCREKGKLTSKLEVMESLLPIIVRHHPVWTKRNDHIELEEDPLDPGRDMMLKKYNLKIN